MNDRLTVTYDIVIVNNIIHKYMNSFDYRECTEKRHNNGLDRKVT